LLLVTGHGAVSRPQVAGPAWPLAGPVNPDRPVSTNVAMATKHPDAGAPAIMWYYCRDKPSIKKLQWLVALPTACCTWIHTWSLHNPAREACCCTFCKSLVRVCVYMVMSDLSLTGHPPWAGQHCRFCLWHTCLRHYVYGTVCVYYVGSGFLQLQ